MNILKKKRSGRFGVLLTSLFISTNFCLGSELSHREMLFWTQLYHEVNPNGDIHWQKGGPRKWATIEQEQIEPIVAAVLRDEREDIPWNYALSIAAPLMPTPAICDEVCARMEAMFSEKLAAKAPLLHFPMK